MGLALVITVSLAIQVEDEDQEQEGVIQVAHSHQRPDRSKSAVANESEGGAVPQQLPVALNWGALTGRTRLVQEPDHQSADLFKPHDWYVVSKPTGPPPPPPKPVAPEAPFTYLGKLEDTPQGTKFFLTENILPTLSMKTKIQNSLRFSVPNTAFGVTYPTEEL